MIFLYSTENVLLKIIKQKQSLFSWTYSSTGFSRASLIISNCTDCYASAIDNKEELHTVAKNTRGQIIYCRPDHKTVLFEENDFTFSDFNLVFIDNDLHFFYTALDKYGNTTLLHQVIFGTISAVASLVTHFKPIDISVLHYNDCILIFYVSEDDPMNIYSLMLGMSKPSIAVSTDVPITHFSPCIVNDEIHIAYVYNMYGQYQVAYTNGRDTAVIGTVAKPSEVAVLAYLDAIWLSYVDGDVLYTSLSVDNGKNFSMPIKNSVQDNLVYTKFCNKTDLPISSTAMYSQITPIRLLLPIICNLDVYGVHPDKSSNIELELFLAGLEMKFDLALNRMAKQATPQVEKPSRSLYVEDEPRRTQPPESAPLQVQQPPQMQQPSQSQQVQAPPQVGGMANPLMNKPAKVMPSNLSKPKKSGESGQPAKPKKSADSMKNMAKAFMEQGTNFDAPMKK
ncbi:MAG: hypothetical protein ATN35_12335 [Epulopiscium sp. Nele67-Bin004]|nr:MAG: hypothetical protein ATN35_12335 [Epulopiscium sp. Nele67-Bin004]